MEKRITILTDTTDIPITMIGEYAGECWGADTTDHEKNYKRGLDCIECNHGRTLEFPQVYLKIEGYSARVIRELYTHIGSLPSRLQASTRYIDYGNFDYVVPPSVKTPEDKALYEKTMFDISQSIKTLEENGVPREDTAMLLPLGMTTTVVMRTNLRHLIDMAAQRECTRAYWEFRDLMRQLKSSLAFYSDEWNTLIRQMNIMKPKCEILGYCPEKKSCGRKEKKANEHDNV